MKIVKILIFLVVAYLVVGFVMRIFVHEPREQTEKEKAIAACSGDFRGLHGESRDCAEVVKKLMFEKKSLTQQSSELTQFNIPQSWVGVDLPPPPILSPSIPRDTPAKASEDNSSRISNLSACIDTKIAIFRKESGQEPVISNDMLKEIEDDCRTLIAATKN